MMIAYFAAVLIGFYSTSRFVRWLAPRSLLWKPVFKLLRGSGFLSTNDADAEFEKTFTNNDAQSLSIAGFSFADSVANTGILVAGVPGTGKSRLIIEYVLSIVAGFKRGSGKKLVIFDPKNEFVSILFNRLPHDVPLHLLNPFDRRSTRWNIAEDVVSPAEAVTAASTLIAEQANDTNVFFSRAARAVLRDSVRVFQHHAPGRWTLRHLLALVRSPNIASEVLKSLPETATSADQFLARKAGRDVAATASASLDTLAAAAAAWDLASSSISIRQFLATEGVVILGWDDRIGPALSNLYGLFLELLVNQALVNSSCDARTYIVIDELRMLPKACGNALNRAAFRGRSAAVCPLVAFQDFNSLLEVYGHAGAKELLANFQTKLFLRLGSQEAAEWAAQCLGKPEATWRTGGESRAWTRSQVSSYTFTRSWTEHVGDRYLVHPSQLLSLPLADRERDCISGYIASSWLGGCSSFEAPFLEIAKMSAPHPDFPDYWMRDDSDQILKPFTADDLDHLSIPVTDLLLAALAGQ